jgi:hypothetical protein
MTTKSLLDERRLVSRVLRHWDERSSDRFPGRSDIDPWLVGADWANCLLLALDPVLEQSRFVMVGDNLHPHASEVLDDKPITACPSDTFIHALLAHVPQCLNAKGPLSIAGNARHLGRPVLYRSVLLPLAEDGATIDGMLIAANYREMRAAEEKELRARREVVVLRVKTGQVWELFNAVLGGWDKAVVVAIEGGKATLRSKTNFQKSTHAVAEMTAHPERYRFIAHR